MKKLLLCSVLFITMLQTADAQILFSEDFDGIGGPTAGGAGTYSFPAGWFLRNVDNRTPAGAVSYVNEAWERREDFGQSVVDSCAFSTSWYSPAGPADDWMWTPLIGPISAATNLTWNAKAYDPLYPDGYEVRIMTAASGPPTGGTGTIGNQVTNSTVVFTIGAENTTWTNRSVSLGAYAGQSVYVGFRNTSNDMFLLVIDDIIVSTPVVDDAQISFVDTITPYTMVPLAQVQPLNVDGIVRNNGSNNISNIYVTADFFDGTSTMVYTANSATIASLTPGATSPFSIAGFTPAANDFYTGRFIVHHATTDPYPMNDTVWWNGYLVDDSTYARDDGTVTGGLGIGAGNGGYLGQDFQVVATDLMTQVMVYVTAGYTGEPMAAVIWNMSGGVPTTILASTDTLLYPDDSARVYYLPIHNGPLSIAPGMYAVTFAEFDSTMQLGQSQTIFTGDHTWVNWPTSPAGGWANLEYFGTGFMRAQVIRPIFGDVCLNNTATAVGTQASCISCADGTASVTTTGGTPPETYLWSPGGGTGSTETGLLTGIYTVTVTDAFGCVSTDTAWVAYDVCALLASTTDSTETSCGACSDGSAQVIVTGNNGPLTYSWSNGGTSDTIQNVPIGTYYVTYTDSLGCSGSDSVTVTFSTVVSELDAPGALSVYPNPSNGSFQLNVKLNAASDLTVIVTNTLGEVVATKAVNGMQTGRIEMNLDLAAGAYNVHVRSGDSEKIIPITIQK